MKIKRKLILLFVCVLVAGMSAAACSNEPTAQVDSVNIVHARIVGKKMNVIIGAVYMLDAEIKDKDGKAIDVERAWTSADSSIVKISEDGTFQGRKEGKTTVTLICGGKEDTVEISVVYKEQVPVTSRSSTNRSDGLSDKAFDRSPSTAWISDITQAADETNDYLQANYNEKRELKKVVIRFTDSASYALPVKIEVCGVEEIIGDDEVVIAETTNIESHEITVLLDDIAYYKFYRLKFYRESGSYKDFAVSEVELWSDTVLTK